MDFFRWSESDPPARVVDLRRGGALAGLLFEYGPRAPRVLTAVLAQAFRLDAQMAVIEYRYMDPDYRNEHSRFYSTTFRRYPSVAHRLHFFKEHPPTELLDNYKPAAFSDLTYLGFSILRPVPGAPVGRTMLTPPQETDDYVTCKCSDSVNFLGIDYWIEAAPFMAQDAQLSVCAHTTVWVTTYYHHLRFRTPRILPGDIVDAVPSEVGLGRPMPSTGLSVHQISEACARLGLPAVVYRVDQLPPGESLFRVICRYLNSGLPVTVAGGGHAWVLVGYRRTLSAGGDERIEFIRQDDEVGPYQVVANPLLDTYSPWQFIIVPLPRKVYLVGEEAEAHGRFHILRALRGRSNPETSKLLSDINDKEVSFRSRVMLSNEFKTGLDDREVDADLRTVYQRMHLSRWIWVVEAAYREERNRGEPCVAAEAILDATDHVRDLHVLARRIPGNISTWVPDKDEVGHRDLGPMPLLRSVGLGQTRMA